jgi:hypothetical protein
MSPLTEKNTVWCKATFGQITTVNPGIGPLNCIAIDDSKIYLAVSNHRGRIILFDIEVTQLIKRYQTNDFEAIACLAFCVSLTRRGLSTETSLLNEPT